MACFYPIKGWRPRLGNKIVFNPAHGYADRPVTLPCGQCVGCRLEHSRQWAIRCVHEAQLHQDNCFITLTYNDDYLPENGTLVKRDFQLFMKRLRKKYPHAVRYYQCGEYGSKTHRPHYHACLFGHDFKDKTLWQKGSDGTPLYISSSLQDLWSSDGHSIGFSTIGTVTFQSAAYVARYIMKKI
uniref:rolling circle replication-associated protein n=1 Tax=Shewanella sp. TaxID=50422 RepID=UPI0040482461